MIVLGLDSGGRYNGLAVGDLVKKSINRAELFMQPFTKPSPDKLIQVVEFATSWVTKFKPACVVAENYAFGGMNFNREVPEVFGVYKMVFHKCRVPLILVPPSSAKKAVTG
jgi:Holliday junction resolvasome RuvABC endonuclease subunit